jgi:hypothetical protein
VSILKLLTIGAIVLFTFIGIAAYLKNQSPTEKEDQSVLTSSKPLLETAVLAVPVKSEPLDSEKLETKAIDLESGLKKDLKIPQDDFPMIDRVFQLFTTGPSKLPIIETITYTSCVPWLKGRPAWVADYAAHYNTSRHFIARSLNGKADYFSQKVFEGSKFNVFRKDKRIQFYLLVDISLLKMGFYYIDLDTNERILLKTYRVGLGRLDDLKPSGSLTPLGRYALGSKVAVYHPGTTSYILDQKQEMIRLFGTRWIPFDQEIERTTAPARGYGIYGAPWNLDEKTGKWSEQRKSIGKYDTDGGIRLLSEDLEEIFSIIISKPSFVEIVRDFREARLPGVEVAVPTR